MKRFMGLGSNQQAVFDQIAVGTDTGHPRSILKTLEMRGLIESHEEPIYGRGNSLMDRIPMMVRRYTVPYQIHRQWCEWCSATLAVREGAPDA